MTYIRIVIFIFFSTITLVTFANEDYQLGHGLKLSDAMIVGGYFSSELEYSEDNDEFAIDDLALIVYGNITPKFSYLVELESVDFYKSDLTESTEEWNVPPSIERLYFDYHFSDVISLRAGKQITPVGYWNLQPINVLRETTSNPLFSRELFPKFLTGLDFYGYVPFDDTTSWHFFLQNTKDLDDSYVNISVDKHYGFSFEKAISEQLHIGGTIGYFQELTDAETTYIQLNAKYTAYPFKYTLEAIYQDKNQVSGADINPFAYYLQGEYKVASKHTLIGRIESFDKDIQTGTTHVTTLGYNYRPLFPVSLKLEYQWFNDSDENHLLASFSVLF